MNPLYKKFILGFLVVVLAAVGLVLLPKVKQSDNPQTPPPVTDDSKTDDSKTDANPADNLTDQIKNLIDSVPDKNPIKAVVPPTEKQKLLADLKAAADKEDYVVFADLLKKVYDNVWQNEKDFEGAESAAYVSVDKKYFTPGDYTKSLEISTTVYNKVPTGWRFAYLRILTLEKLGRIAFEKGDLAASQDYALAILRMSFRLEGTNLLADIYIQKIEADVAAKEKTQAMNDYNYIKDFEVSADRTAKLNQLKKQIDQL